MSLELATSKYYNFIKLLIDNNISNNITDKLKNVNFLLFIRTFKNKYIELNKDKEKIKKYVIDEFKINITDFKNEFIDKIYRYLDFFIDLSNI